MRRLGKLDCTDCIKKRKIKNTCSKMNRYFNVWIKYLSDYRFELCQNQEVQQNQDAKDNAVITEDFEVFALDIAHQEFDGKD